MSFKSQNNSRCRFLKDKLTTSTKSGWGQMDYLNNILSQNNSKVHSVDEAIPTLCNRLQHATLSSDRRSAILGLKSFSRQYRELVVEYGLRPLLLALKKDSDNSAVIRPLLECILILLIRGEGDEDMTRGWISQQSRIQNGKYPSPLLLEDISYDQFSLWISDELTKDGEMISVVLDIMANDNDYHVRLYTIQLLESLVSTRSVKVKDCLLNIPTGISTIVSLLSDPNDPVRNEAILLLMAITNNNFNIQKLVAFENTFDRLFAIIEEEGGIRGSVLVQDCLTLITNLLIYNASNQKFFLETQGALRLSELLGEPLEDEQLVEENGGEEEPFLATPPMIWTEQRVHNMMIALDICRTFVSEANDNLKSNQDKLNLSGILFIVLRLVFAPETINEIRSFALLTAADLIRGNNEIQLQFSNIDIPYIDPSLPTQIQSYEKPLPITVALLDWTLYINSVHCFNIRSAAAYCLRAYFTGNSEAQIAFLQDQINTYKTPETETTEENGNLETHENGRTKGIANGNSPPPDAIPSPMGNIFSTLMDYNSEINLNPYRIWFAAIILLYLFEDNDECKELSRNVKTGDESLGEEELTCVEAVSGLLVTTLENNDPRIAIGYLMLLTTWMYEDPVIVNEFLKDSSIVHSILTFITNNSSESSEITRGMCTVLLGVAYDFCMKDAPISRVDLHSLLVKSLGKDNYSLKVKKFKESPEFRLFEEDSFLFAHQDETGLPDVYFDSIYVNLVKDNFTRIKRALFHDPNFEPQTKISYEEFEELDLKFKDLYKEYEEAKKATQEHESNLTKEIDQLKAARGELQVKFDETSLNHKDLIEKNALTISELESITNRFNELSQKKSGLEKSSTGLSKELESLKKTLTTSDESIKLLESKLEQAEDARKKAEEGINKMSRELFHLTKDKEDLSSEVKVLQKEIEKLKKESEKATIKSNGQIQKFQDENKTLQGKISKLEADLISSKSMSEAQLKEVKEKILDAEGNNEHLMDKLRSAATAFQEMKLAKSDSDERVSLLETDLSKKQEEVEDVTLKLRESQSKLESLQKELDEFKSSIQTKNDESSVLVEKLQSLNKELESKNKKLDVEIQDLKTRFVGLEEDFDGLVKANRTQALSFETERTELQKKIKELTGEHSKSLEGYSTLAAELEEWKEKYRVFEATSQKTIEDNYSQVNSLKDMHSEELGALKDKYESEITSLKDRVTELSTSIDEESQKASKLNEELVSIGKLHAEKEALLKESNRQVKEKEDSFTNLKTELNQKVASHEKVIKEKEDSLNEFRKQVEEKKTSLSELTKQLDEKVDSFRNTIGEKDCLLDDLKKQIEEKVESHSKELMEKEGLLASLKTEFEDMRIAHAKLISERDLDLSKLKEDLNLSEKSVSDQTAKVKAIEADLSSKTKELGDKQQTITELEKSLKSKEENLYEAESKLESELKERKDLEEKLNKQKLLSEKALEKNKTTTSKLNDLQSKYDDETRKLNEKVATSEEIIQGLKNDLEERLKEVQKDREILSQSSETVVKEYTDRIKKLELSISELKTNHETKSKGLVSEKDLLNDKLVKLRTEYEDFKVNSESEQANLKDSTEEQEKILANLKVELDSKFKDLAAKEKELRDSQQSIQELSKSSVEKERSLKEKADKISALESELANITAKHILLEESHVTLSRDSSEALQTTKELQEKSQKSVNDLELQKTELSSKISKLESQVTKLEKDNDTLRSSSDSASKTNEELQYIKSKKEELSTQFTDFEASHKAFEIESNALLASKESKIKELEKQLVAVNAEVEKSAAAVKEGELKHTKTNEETSKALKDLSERISEYEKQIKELQDAKAKSEKELKNTRIESEKDLEEQSKVVVELKAELEASKSAAETFKAELSTSKAAAESLHTELATSKASAESLRAELATSKISSDTLKAELQKQSKADKDSSETLRTEIDQLRKQSESTQADLKKHIESLKAQLKSSTKETVAKSELDDLMLLLSEMEDSKDKYKAKLKALGGEVSDDDDDDDDDEEDEDEDDDDVE
ncbi:Vesicle-mediated ER to Golgi transport protein [Yamadazyma tenuis]|uniref:Vesicle-mediated ER to Golgi transport protein n=1 Tax=Candida tenuis TaxID=2315449 RepID=UPI0027A52E8F|nr:Vesicle-mediated ER to Golgi transport protein [Yamadazyma tenuis]